MPETVAFIDVGTNSIHMLVVWFYEGSLGTPVFHDKETVRMGKSLYETGRLDAPTIRKAKLVLEKFADIARSNGCTDIVAMATCAAARWSVESSTARVLQPSSFLMTVAR